MVRARDHGAKQTAATPRDTGYAPTALSPATSAPVALAHTAATPRTRGVLATSHGAAAARDLLEARLVRLGLREEGALAASNLTCIHVDDKQASPRCHPERQSPRCKGLVSSSLNPSALSGGVAPLKHRRFGVRRASLLRPVPTGAHARLLQVAAHAPTAFSPAPSGPESEVGTHTAATPACRHSHKDLAASMSRCTCHLRPLHAGVRTHLADDERLGRCIRHKARDVRPAYTCAARRTRGGRPSAATLSTRSPARRRIADQPLMSHNASTSCPSSFPLTSFMSSLLTWIS